MKRIAATLVTSALVGALVAPAFAGSPTVSPVQRSQVIPPSTVMPPSSGVGQTRSGPDTQAWRGEARRPDWDGSGPYYPKWRSYTPVYVPAQWVWDGHMWVLAPGYWAY